ncbi:probable isoprenylcysteine alpha-carbonyl methylesterase ICMEL2 [Cynara cardunculus var. scolymus]|uniref:protein-S-isoprenylcysteine alpha-carbonyl methylesterase n=1 Tax=Cynara cardunculus var. scolymus TaxID=59895 RepID=A0A124SG51_CYNCS|nr:probable isoprenylcysteine alpha-carbonyl methylesterase ICMEL2 [Cynara cardunculus var. scolymus]KVI05328.1 Alpha/beta hydrolase fold-3 [Cynara cardunculus var. scolymus]
MHKSFTKPTRVYLSKMQSHILPISISNPFLSNRASSSSIIPISAAAQAGAVFINSDNYDGDDLAHSSIEDGKKVETKPLLPRVSSHDSISSTRLPSTSTGSVSFQKRRGTRTASESNLSDLRGGRRRFLCHNAGRTDGDTFSITRFGSKVLGYIGSGYRVITGFLALQCYGILIMPGVLQVAYYYYFSSQVRRDIVFGDQPRNKLDIYLPKNDGKNDDPKPVIAFITGGAWVIGYKAWGSLLGLHLSGTDVIVACIDYRNFPKATISDMVEDASRGISFVCNNISEYGGDPNRIYLMGQSAGAHIAACALVDQAIKESDVTQSTTWSVSQIKAYFGLSGGYNLFNLADHLNTRGPYKSIFLSIMGGEESLSRYSPEIVVQDPKNKNAVSLLPPVILFHGTADYSIPADSSKTFVDTLQRLGVKADLMLYKGKTHTDVFVQDPMRGDDKLFDDLVAIVHAGDEEARRKQVNAPPRRRLVPEFMLKLAAKISPF